MGCDLPADRDHRIGVHRVAGDPFDQHDISADAERRFDAGHAAAFDVDAAVGIDRPTHERIAREASYVTTLPVLASRVTRTLQTRGV